MALFVDLSDDNEQLLRDAKAKLDKTYKEMVNEALSAWGQFLRETGVLK